MALRRRSITGMLRSHLDAADAGEPWDAWLADEGPASIGIAVR
jgi:hypothetical protein